MRKLTDDGLIFIDKQGQITRYERTAGIQHNDLLHQYQKIKHYDEVDRTDIAKNKQEILFYIYNKDQAAAFLPKTLTDEQLYSLELLQDGMDSLQLLEVRKYKEQDYQDFILTGDDIADQFSNEVIQSYFTKSSKRKAK